MPATSVGMTPARLGYQTAFEARSKWRRGEHEHRSADAGVVLIEIPDFADAQSGLWLPTLRMLMRLGCLAKH